MTENGTRPMFDTRLLVLMAETPVHAGSGAELGAVDLPVQRERHTRYPTIHGSGVKGVLRDLCERRNGNGAQIATLLFGSPPPEGPGGNPLEAGSLAVSDARLLLLPVRSAGNVFAWTTCPYALQRLARDLGRTGASVSMGTVAQPEADEAFVTKRFPVDSVLLEEFELRAAKGRADQIADALGALLPEGAEMQYWRELLPRNLVVVADDLFADLALHGTEVVTRVRLTEEKTVERGALWSEEYLPADTVLYTVLGLQQTRLSHGAKKAEMENGGWSWVRDFIEAEPVGQFGGKETIGRGFLRMKLWPAEGGR